MSLKTIKDYITMSNIKRVFSNNIAAVFFVIAVKSDVNGHFILL